MFKILTDSCCDFSGSTYQDLGVAVKPLTVNFRGESYDDRNDDSLGSFYDGLKAGEVATTSAINPQGWESLIRPVLEQGEDVLVMAFSSGLSTTYQSAVIAANELAEEYPERKILICDTLCASMGQGLLVWHACRLRDQGLSIDEIYRWLEENKLHLCHWFTVDDLMFLKRGGRVSAATAVLGTMLSIKPILHVDDTGHLCSVAKARGRKASLDALVEKYAQLSQGYDNPVVFISHGNCPEDAAYVAQKLKTKCGVTQVEINYIGAVIGSHAGPGTVALFFLGSNR